MLAWHKSNPPSRSIEGTHLRQKMAAGTGTIYDRAKLDAMYQQNDDFPSAVQYIFVAAGSAFLLGLGFFAASTPDREIIVDSEPIPPITTPSPLPPTSIAQSLKTLSELKDAGNISAAEFDLAKMQVLNTGAKES